MLPAMSGSPYSKKLVAFFDVLGSRELIRASETQPELATHMLDALKQIANPESNLPNFRASTFSDCTCISVDDTPDSRLLVCSSLAQMSFAMFGLGYPLRGAIVVGDIHHDSGLLIGPALVEAYVLESRVALYPRIILSPSFSYQPIGYAKELDLLRQDFDGFWFVNFLSRPFINELSRQHGVDASTVPKTIENVIKGLEARASKRPDILPKIGWLRSYSKQIGY